MMIRRSRELELRIECWSGQTYAYRVVLVVTSLLLVFPVDGMLPADCKTSVFWAEDNKECRQFLKRRLLSL